MIDILNYFLRQYIILLLIKKNIHINIPIKQYIKSNNEN